MRLKFAVLAKGGVVRLEGESTEGSAVLGASRVGNTAEPDCVSAAVGNRAGLEARLGTAGCIDKDELAVLVDGPALTLSVPGSGLGSSGISDEALAHAGPVDKDVLGWLAGMEGESAVAQLERSEVLGFATARSALLGCVDVDAAVSSLDGAELDGGAGAEAHEGEDIAVVDLGVLGAGLGGSRDHGGSGSSNGGGGELHSCGRWS